MKRKKNKPRKHAAGSPMLQIKTTIDFGEDGIPLEQLGKITKLQKERHLGAHASCRPRRRHVLSKTQVACAKSLECAAVCCNHVRVD